MMFMQISWDDVVLAFLWNEMSLNVLYSKVKCSGRVLKIYTQIQLLQKNSTSKSAN